MKTIFYGITTCFFLSLVFPAIGQCDDIAVPDSSFESGTFKGGGFPFILKTWYRDDGCELSGEVAYDGDSSACSIAGGAFQVVKVDSNTTYYLNGYILNGFSDPDPTFRINWIHYPISVTTDNWTLVSQGFNSGSDTTAIIGFYTGGACFDLFSLTCSPLVGIDDLQEDFLPYNLYPNVFSTATRISTIRPSKIELIDANGRVLQKMNTIDQEEKIIGEGLSSGLYWVRIMNSEGIFSEKIIKL